MHHHIAMDHGSRLFILKRQIVERLDRENTRTGRPEHWRMVGHTVQVGTENVVGHRTWRSIPVLSVELLQRYRVQKEAEAFPDIPF
jgi:hypothetical protein